MIINVAHTKGGVGKSTLSCNLAIELNTPLIDLDMQKSCLFFNETRSLKFKPINVTTITNRNEFKILEPYAGDSKNHIIIDSGGMDNDLNRLALIYADIILTPIGLSQIELFGLDNFNNILSELEINPKKKFIVLNNINTRSSQELEQIEEIILNDYKLQLLHTTIGARKAFKDAFAEGRSVVEKSKKSLAAQEIMNLIKEVKEIIKVKFKDGDNDEL